MNTLHMHILEISWLCTMTEPRCTDTPVAMSTPSCRILALKYHYPRAETGEKKRYAWWWCQWKWESKNPLLHKINENKHKTVKTIWRLRHLQGALNLWYVLGDLEAHAHEQGHVCTLERPKKALNFQLCNSGYLEARSKH